VSALVVEVANGAHLLWVEGGRLWRADQLSRGSGYTPWMPVTDVVPGLGGRVLADAEVARLIAPPGCGVSR
jgi:hypothetical protein